MFLRRHRKQANGETYEYWSLVKTVRTARGPRHQLVARLGKLDGKEIAAARSWQDLDVLLEGRTPATQLELTPAGSSPPASVPCWREVDLSGVRVERLRQFGRVYLGLALWRRLDLHTLLQQLLPVGREEVGWDLIACVLALGRFCAQPSELSLAERWYDDTALEDLLGVPLEKINDARLYRGLDTLLPHKDALCQHLLAKYRDWFKVRLEFLLYDVTSTYFEGLAKIAKIGSLGVDAVVVQPFTRDFAAISAEDFVPFIKRHLPRLAGIYVGENFRFGQGRRGDVAMLVSEGKRHAISVFSAPRVNLDGEPISSTRIRERILTGDMKGAAALLGYTYTAEGNVVHGKHLGRTIGFPTLNLGWSPDLRPLYGVYAVRVRGPKS